MRRNLTTEYSQADRYCGHHHPPRENAFRPNLGGFMRANSKNLGSDIA